MIIPLQEGRMKLLKGLLIFGLMTFFIFSHGQDSMRISLDMITISADRLPSLISKSVRSVSKLDVDDLRLTSPLRSFSEFTSQVPGLFISNDYNSAQDLRISMRGFGSRSAFGIRGIKILVDGIPETTADGQGQIDHLTINDIQSIEVLRGPNASLFGNAAGGAISIRSTSYKDAPKLELISRFGQFGYGSVGVKSALSNGNNGGVITAIYNHTTGYREHSQSKQINIAGRWHQKITNGHLKFGLEYTDSPKGQDPGGVNLDQVTNDPQSARDRNLLFDAGEEINRWKTWVTVDSDLNENWKLKSNIFYSNRNFLGRLPFANGGNIDLGRNYGGHGSQLIWQQNGSKSINKLLLGYDIGLQTDDRQRFFNDEGVKGQQTLDQDEIFRGIGIYLMDRWQSNNWAIEGSLRWDRNVLELRDRFLEDGDNSGTINLSNLNPSLGLNYKINSVLNMYAIYGRSFETPTLNELSNNPNGQGFNPELSAQESSNIEFGLRRTEVSKMNFDLSVFRISSNNETIPFELENFPGRTFYRNAGSTRRVGVEFGLLCPVSSYWSAGLNYSIGSFEFRDYRIDNENLEGNKFPGVPEHFGTFRISFERQGWQMQLSWEHVNRIFGNDKNTVVVDARNRIQLNLSKEIRLGDGIIIPMLSIQNLLDDSYYDNIRINAFGGRYYEAAPGRMVTLGINYQLIPIQG